MGDPSPLSEISLFNFFVVQIETYSQGAFHLQQTSVSWQKIETLLAALPGVSKRIERVHRLHLGASNILILPWILKTPCLLLQQPPTCFEQEDREPSYRDVFSSQYFGFVGKNGLKNFSTTQNGGGDCLVSFT